MRVMFEPLLRQFFGAVRHVIGTVIRAGLAGLVIGFAAVELVGALFEGSWPHRVFVHIAAVAFALVLGYAVAMTMAFFEGVRGIFGAVSEVETEIEGTIRNVVGGATQGVQGVVDAVEHRPQHQNDQQPYPVAPPVAAPYNPNPQYGSNSQYPTNPPYGQNLQYSQNPTYPTNPPYPPRQ
jgi:hypothetical protein